MSRSARSARATVAATAALLALTVVVVGVGATIASKGGAPGRLTVRDAWSGPGQGITAVYLTIDNPGETDRLVGVTGSDGTALNASFMGTDMDVAHPVPGAQGVLDQPIPSGVTELRPGESHLMLEDLTAPLEPGQRLPLQLRFATAGPVAVEVEVLSWDEVAERA